MREYVFKTHNDVRKVKGGNISIAAKRFLSGWEESCKGDVTHAGKNLLKLRIGESIKILITRIK